MIKIKLGCASCCKISIANTGSISACMQQGCFPFSCTAEDFWKAVSLCPPGTMEVYTCGDLSHPQTKASFKKVLLVLRKHPNSVPSSPVSSLLPGMLPGTIVTASGASTSTQVSGSPPSPQSWQMADTNGRTHLPTPQKNNLFEIVPSTQNKQDSPVVVSPPTPNSQSNPTHYSICSFLATQADYTYISPTLNSGHKNSFNNPPKTLAY